MSRRYLVTASSMRLPGVFGCSQAVVPAVSSDWQDWHQTPVLDSDPHVVQTIRRGFPLGDSV